MPETILIVDDSPTNLEVLFKTLDASDYRILAARSGDMALEIVKQELPTLVLLDIMMPGMDGFEVCRRIKADPDMQRCAVIFLSALGDTDAKVRGFQLGGVDYIAKPFQAEEVVARVATHVRIQQLERELEQRNEALESEFQRILATMAEGVYGLDATGAISYMNQAATQLTGFNEVDVRGRNVFDLHFQHVDDSAWLHEQPWQALSRGLTIRADNLIIARADASCFAAEICVTPSFLNGEFLGGVLVFRDISKRVKAEAALQDALHENQRQRQRMAHVERLSTMGEMAAGFAHEVNQPLTAITNYASVAIRLLSGESVDHGRMEETLRKLQTQAIRASDVIQRLRDFAKTPKNNKIVRDLNQLAQTVVGLAEVDSRNHGIKISIDVADQVLPVFIDDVQIQQVALNLVRNALEATQAARNDSSPVHIRLYRNAGRALLSVRDYGVGLAENAEENLFNPFYTTKTNGMGIGLSVCASIMQEHGGTINFERCSIGTEFVINLPLYSD